jgi:hypothetical protein
LQISENLEPIEDFIAIRLFHTSRNVISTCDANLNSPIKLFDWLRDKARRANGQIVAGYPVYLEEQVTQASEDSGDINEQGLTDAEFKQWPHRQE